MQVLGPQDGVVKNALTQALLSVETSGASPDAAWADAGKKIDSQTG